MKIVIVFAVATVCVVFATPNEKYTTKYDNVDLDSIFKSDRLLTNYVNCLMERGRCTPDGSELKKNLPDALQNDCSKCSEGQRDAGKRVSEFLLNNKPDIFKELEAKYDPEGIYRKKYESRMNKEE